MGDNADFVFVKFSEDEGVLHFHLLAVVTVEAIVSFLLKELIGRIDNSTNISPTFMAPGISNGKR